MMIWDLDALRDEFVRRELFHTPLLRDDTFDQSSKRAALLSSYIAILLYKAVPTTTTSKLHFSIFKAFPYYHEYDLSPSPCQFDTYTIGSHSLAFQRLVHFRASFDDVYDFFESTSAAFAKLMSCHARIICRVQL